MSPNEIIKKAMSETNTTQLDLAKRCIKRRQHNTFKRWELKIIAEQQGQSLNAFILTAIDEKIDRLNHSPHLNLDELLN